MRSALRYDSIIRAQAKRTGIPPSVIAATLAKELEYGEIQVPKDFLASTWKSPADISTGIGQIKPKTAREIDRSLHRPECRDEEYRKRLRDPEENIKYLADYLALNASEANKILKGRFDRTNDYHWLGVVQAHNSGYPVLKKWDPYAQQALRNIRFYYQNE